MAEHPTELPLFPLHTVLVPEAHLPLKVFEARYMDMIKDCIKTGEAFGVCLIEEGQEVGAPAVPAKVGTSARVLEWDMAELGILQIVVGGERRFRVAHAVAQRDGLLRAVVEWLPEATTQAPSAALADTLPLLEAVVADAGIKAIPQPHRFDDANWVGYRYTEILPIPMKAKQKLLELDDPLMRLTIIRQFLIQRGLLKPAG
ncbi:LON peptidase substrate-binding domain-containing protein [Niveibacterium sp. 24ML]|uniref:LON peptidase substrate-binding domain-containing protein n=1 Tax=Niveibacterium sp. 24ML TaxID=2985512 RepID=UPI00226DADB9|nr:LON peptidase substrate-binding domain-containing protein [Niveibacterium sp. 24ML]MCX9157388.1 LON peptidase substrate-binding domain-containing protein [Niveibacterium sp. 24ML]